MSQVFQQYILRQQIARKKTSVLYLAHTIDNAEDLCVIKAYDTLDIHEEDEQQQFLQELLVVNELEHHNILPPLNGGIERGYPYIVNTYMPAGSLYQRLQDGAYPSPLEETLALLTAIGDALAYAHAQGRIHGNLKPENVLFGPDGVPLLTDFCLPSIDAQFKHSTHFRQLLNARTACYMAPEQFSKKADALSDQYALGCMAYELLSGQPPFQAAALSTWKSMHEHEQPLALSQLVPTLPPELEAVVHKALAKEPSQRHADMTAFVEALVAYSAAEPFNVIVATAHTQTIWDESDAAGLAEELAEIKVDGGQAEARTVAEPAEIKVDEEQVETVQERELILAAFMSASPIESSAELPLVEPGTQTPSAEPRNGVPRKVAPLVGLTPFLTTMRTLAARPSTSDVPPSRQILTKMTWPLICILCVLIGTSVVLLLLRHQLPAYMSMSRTVTAFSQPAASPGASTATVTVTPVQLQALPTPTVLPTQNGAQIQQFVPPTPTVPANPSVNDGTHGSKHHAGGGGTSHPSPASSPTPTPSPTPEPTVTPTIAATPTATPTVLPTATPTTEPTNTPTPSSEELRWFLKHLKFFWWGW